MRLGLAIAAIVTGVTLAAAQDYCGSGLPCGPVPWPVPQLPTLAVPTLIPTQVMTPTPDATATPTPTPTATFTPTITPTPTAGIDVQVLMDQLGTLEAVIQATPATDDVDVPTLESGSNVFWGYLKGVIDGLSLGVLTPLFLGFIGIAFMTFAVELLRFVLPLAAVVFGWLRKIVQLVLDFIPG